MRKLIRINEIKLVSEIISENLKTLNSQINTLLTDIDTINNYYKGVDADIIINKYKERVKNLNSVIANYENYLNYFNMLTGSYVENINTSCNNLNNMLEDYNVDDNNQNNLV